jgi:ankyrin repeat protein
VVGHRSIVTADNHGNTPLHFAAKGGTPESIDRCIDNGDDPNAQNDEGRTPMHIAYLHGKIENAIELARRGARGDIRDNQGNTPFDLDPSQH